MNKKIKVSDYLFFLDSNPPEFESDAWIIGGKLRYFHRMENKYGAALKKYDPIGFNVGFQEYERKFYTRM